MTRWRWATLSPEIALTLTLDSDDPELIAKVEYAAQAQNITLVRIEDDEPAPLPADYAEAAE